MNAMKNKSTVGFFSGMAVCLTTALFLGLNQPPRPDPMAEITRDVMTEMATCLREFIDDTPLPKDSSIKYTRTKNGWETNIWYSVDTQGNVWASFDVMQEAKGKKKGKQ